MPLPRIRRRAAAATVTLALVLVGCSSEDADEPAGTTEPASTTLREADASAAATTYADQVHTRYTEVVGAATEVRSAVDSFLADPSPDTLEAARSAWLSARDLYGTTEAFRFYDGPIDNPDDGPEGQINAWPMDEAYVDYVEGDGEAGIINDVAGVPEITREVIVAANEQGGETNISTGWHAIEFLLWGQDLADSGPGERPVSDYTTSPTAERRATYLRLVTDQLVEDLGAVADQWDPESGDYRREFLTDPNVAVANILRGMGALSAGELAGERLAVAYETREQEDEHSCFSDNTVADVIANAEGIRLAYTAAGAGGTSLSDAVATVAPDLDEQLRSQLDATVALAEQLATFGTFEEIIRSEDDSEGRTAMLQLIEDLQAQGDTIAELGSALGYTISLDI
jgi:putative iron-regulated protein